MTAETIRGMADATMIDRIQEYGNLGEALTDVCLEVSAMTLFLEEQGLMGEYEERIVEIRFQEDLDEKEEDKGEN